MAILRDACAKGLIAHNAHRAKHIDTLPMELDDKLCQDAQTYAEKLVATGVLKHPTEELNRLKQGENLYWSSNGQNDKGQNDPVLMAEKASDAWYAEIANYDWKTGGPNGNTKIARGQIGHFTALVWQQTNKLGIGVAFKGNAVFVVARYQPRGNYVGRNLTYVKPLKDDGATKPEPPKPEPTEPVKPAPEPVKETLIALPVLKRGTLIKTLANLYKRFDIKMEFMLVRPKSKTQGWSNLVHFTCGSDCAEIGDRIPAIWFHPGEDRLHIRTAIDADKNGGVDGSKPLKLGLTKIHISQKPDANGKWCFSAVVDNNGEKKMYKSLFKGTARDFKDVKVYVSDPWYEAADNAHVLSLDVQTEPEPEKPEQRPEPEPEPKPEPVKKTWTTAMDHTAKYETYGGDYNGHYRKSRMKTNDSNFWHSGKRTGHRAVKVTFEKPVTITSFRVRARKDCVHRYKRVGLHVNGNRDPSAVTPSNYTAARDRFFDMLATEFKKSNASFSGCTFELRWNMSDSCRADQWAQVAFIEIDYFECEDCEPCSPAPEKSLPDNCVNEFSVHSGWIVDAISVNGKKHGPNGGGETKIKLAPGEKITKVKYGRRGYKGKYCMCQLEFYTNKNKKYGPYGSASSTGGCYEVKNVPCDWSEAIKMDRFPVGFAGASPCSQPVDCVKEFSVHSGWIVDAISVNGKKYGPNGGGESKIKLASGERITKVKYGLRGYKGKYCMCQLKFYTNKNKVYGPYGSARSRTRYQEVNNVPCDWSKAIKMNGYPVGFTGSSGCSQPRGG